MDNLTSFGGSLKIQTDFCTEVKMHLITQVLLLFAEILHTVTQCNLLRINAHGFHNAAEIVHSFASTSIDLDTEVVCHGDVYATVIGLRRVRVRVWVRVRVRLRVRLRLRLRLRVRLRLQVRVRLRVWLYLRLRVRLRLRLRVRVRVRLRVRLRLRLRVRVRVRVRLRVWLCLRLQVQLRRCCLAWFQVWRKKTCGQHGHADEL